MKNLVALVIAALIFAPASIAIAAGGPSKEFLAKEMYVVAGGSPMAGGFSVHQIVDALGATKKTWKAFGKGQWMVTVNKTDQMSGKRLSMKMLFTRLRASEGDGVLLKRVIANRQEMNQAQIFQLTQQLAFRAEAKK